MATATIAALAWVAMGVVAQPYACAGWSRAE